MSQRFAQWLSTLADGRRDASSPGSWLGLGVLALVVMALAGLVPATRGFFELRVGPALACFAPAFVFGLVGGTLEDRGRLSLRGYGVLLLVGAALLQFYLASLAMLSSPRGAPLMIVFFFVAACFHGHHHRVTLRYPYGAFSTIAAIAGAALLAPTETHRELLGVMGPAAVGSSFLFGTIGLRAHGEREKQRSLRSALQAQVLEDHVRERERLAVNLVQVLEHNHDASNALTSLMIHAERLAMRTTEPELRAEKLDEIYALVRDLDKGLQRLRGLLERNRGVREETRPQRQAVEVGPVVREAVEAVRVRYPHVALAAHFEPPEAARGEVRMAGGRLSLHRLLENALLNACQGDGVRGARHVELRAHRAPRGRLVFEVRDDGPGFGARQLEAPPRAFETTKPEGSGLGLYTMERLLRASGGELERENLPAGGARVSLRLDENAP